MFSDDGNPTPSNGPGELWFGPSSLPAVEKSLFGGYATVSEIGLSPDASDGIAVNGNNALYFFNGANMGSLTVKPTMLTLSQTAGSEHAAVLLSNGDTAVVSLNNNTNQILEVAGLLNYFSTGTLPSITPIATQEDILGLRLSQDSSVLLARGPSVHVFTVSSNPPYMVTKGSTLNPTVNSQVPELDHTVPQLFSQYWGHGGMAISPQNSSVGAVVGLDITTQKPAISLITRLTSVSPNASITDITGMNHAYSVAMSEDGTTAYVGGDTGVAVFSVNKGSLTQVGTVIAPIAGAGPAVLGEITSLAATLDGTNLLVEGTTTPQLSPLGGAASLNNYIEALPLAADIPGAMPSTFQNDIPLTGTDLLETH